MLLYLYKNEYTANINAPSSRFRHQLLTSSIHLLTYLNPATTGARKMANVRLLERPHFIVVADCIPNPVNDFARNIGTFYRSADFNTVATWMPRRHGQVGNIVVAGCPRRKVSCPPYRTRKYSFRRSTLAGTPKRNYTGCQIINGTLNLLDFDGKKLAKSEVA